MAAPARDMIVIKDLVKQFGPLRAVDGVSLTVPQGQVTVIIGPSGSGKSTVLRCINHLETPSGGEIWVDGKRLTHNSKDINAVRAEVGMVFQQFNLFPHLTTLENIMLAQRVVRKRQQAGGRAHRPASSWSGWASPRRPAATRRSFPGGQQQRVAIARALAMNPKIMLFDEPTSALDPEMIKEVLDVMLDLARDGMTMVVRDARDGLSRATPASEIIFMDRGKIVEQGEPAQFFAAPREERTRQFLSQILH